MREDWPVFDPRGWQSALRVQAKEAAVTDWEPAVTPLNPNQIRNPLERGTRRGTADAH